MAQLDLCLGGSICNSVKCSQWGRGFEQGLWDRVQGLKLTEDKRVDKMLW